MSRVTAVQVVYNSRAFLEPVFSAVFRQTYKDFNVVAVIAGNRDGGKEFLREKFPQVGIIDPGYNLGFAAGHNIVFEKYDSEFFQLVNPDMIMKPTYIEEMIKAFDDKRVGAATGKLLQYNFDKNQKTNIIDTTGVVIYKSGRARDRGQHEVDRGQYDGLVHLQAVSAAGAMYRRQALLATRLPKNQEPRTKNQTNSKFQILNFKLSEFEYMDEDFHSYWEDVDLAWRMSNLAWKNVYVPQAVGYHGRGAGSSEKGYADVPGFIKHHKKLSPRVRRLNYKNHIFMYIKNSPKFYLEFFAREFFMFFYILIFEISTFKVLPEFFGLLPKMWKKRKEIGEIKKLGN